MTAKLNPPAPPTAEQTEGIAALIPDLIRATGPVSYGYQFGPGDLLDRMVAASWPTPDTLFCAASTTTVFDGDELLGIELGFAGPDFYAFKANLAGLASDLMARGVATHDELAGLLERAEEASYLNAHVPDDVYYLHALSAPAAHRGRGAGRALLEAAVARARAAGHRELHLDVLADNPAVGFYRAMGLRILSETAAPRLSRDHGFPSEYRMAVTL